MPGGWAIDATHQWQVDGGGDGGGGRPADGCRLTCQPQVLLLLLLLLLRLAADLSGEKLWLP